jgi:hypothetical protein
MNSIPELNDVKEGDRLAVTYYNNLYFVKVTKVTKTKITTSDKHTWNKEGFLKPAETFPQFRLSLPTKDMEVQYKFVQIRNLAHALIKTSGTAKQADAAGIEILEKINKKIEEYLLLVKDS